MLSIVTMLPQRNFGLVPVPEIALNASTPMKTRFSLLCLMISTALTQGQLTNGLVGYWDFEGSGNNHPLASGGSAINGTLLGGATVTGGAVKVGTGSLLLDGVNDYLDIPVQVVPPNDPWTITAWYRADIAPAGTARFFVFETSGTYSMSFGLREGALTADTNHQSFTDNGPSTDASGNYQLSDAATAATWNHVLMAHTPATPTAAGSISVYINGQLRNTLVIPAGNTLGATTGLHIGTYRLANGRWFDGAIDEVAVWNRTLNGTEAAEVFQRGNAGDTIVAQKYTVTLSVNPAGAGTTTGSGLHNDQASLSISATANPGYIFSGWTGDFFGQPQSFNHTVVADVNATADFEPDAADPDNDGLSNFAEIVTHGSNPNLADTDGDLIPDGAEVNLTGTNPLTSDSALVSFVQNNLASGSAGAILLRAPGIQRDPNSGLVTLLFSPLGSPDQESWQPIDFSHPSASITPAGDGWDLTFPAPSNTVDHYILMEE